MVPAMSDQTPVQSESSRKSLSKREYLQYQSTPDGDIRIIVESPNEGGATALTSIPKFGGSDSGAVDPSFPNTNTNDKKSRHRRDLSAHFQDATNLSDDPTAGSFPPPRAASSHDDLQVSSSSSDEDDAGNRHRPPTYAAAAAAITHGSRPPPPPQASPTVGQKHRRVFSGGGSNPGVAHRRINSRGNTAVVNRGGRSSFRSSPRSSPRMSPPGSFRKSPPLGAGSRRTSNSAGHRREDSGGLDMLSAVANNFTEHELAEAAGAAESGTGAPLPPSRPPPGHKSTQIPSAPSSSFGHPTYQYSNSSQSCSSHGGPPPPSSHYHHHPAGYYGASGEYPPQYDPRYQQPSQNYYHGYNQAPPPTPSYYPEPRGYPVQYAPPRGHYQSDSHPSASESSSRKSTPPQSSAHHPLPVQVMSRSHHQEASAGGEAVGLSDPAYGSYAQRPAPVTSGTSIGSQTFVTSICVDDSKGSGAVRCASAGTSAPPATGSMHHRKMSSFTATIGAFMDDLSPARVAYEVTGGAPASAPRNEPVPPMFQTLDEGDRLLQELSSSQAQPMVSTVAMAYGHQPTHPPPLPLPQASPHASPPPSRSRSTSRSRAKSKVGASQDQAPTSTSSGGSGAGSTDRRYMSGGSSKRVRRKCTIEGCPNRVVQGGLCISHGAKRKQCAHPGCTKNVKKAGLCSTHGPARKRCDHEGCTKVAVQGGRCITHGAKKKLCTMSGCSKQAILAGMCKKHHDEHEGKEPYHGGSSGRKKTGGRKKAGAAKQQKKASIAPGGDLCVIIDEQSTYTAQAGAANQQDRSVAKPAHQRGLSIFADMSAVDTIIGGGDALVDPDDALRNDPDAGSPGSGSEIRAAPSYDGRVPKPTHQRGLSIFTEEAVADTIIQNPDF